VCLFIDTYETHSYWLKERLFSKKDFIKHVALPRMTPYHLYAACKIIILTKIEKCNMMELYIFLTDFVTGPLSPQWTNWTQCSRTCSVEMQMRECREHCEEDKLEIRQCSISQELKCKGMPAFLMSLLFFIKTLSTTIGDTKNFSLQYLIRVYGTYVTKQYYTLLTENSANLQCEILTLLTILYSILTMPVFTWRHKNSNYKTIDPRDILLQWCIRAAEN